MPVKAAAATARMGSRNRRLLTVTGFILNPSREDLPQWRIVYSLSNAPAGATSERTLRSSLSGLLVATVPLLGVVISALAGGQERFGGRRLVGLFLGLGGVALVLGFDVSGASLPAVGELAAVAVGYAIGPMLVAR